MNINVEISCKASSDTYFQYRIVAVKFAEDGIHCTDWREWCLNGRYALQSAEMLYKRFSNPALGYRISVEKARPFTVSDPRATIIEANYTDFRGTWAEYFSQTEKEDV